MRTGTILLLAGLLVSGCGKGAAKETAKLTAGYRAELARYLAVRRVRPPLGEPVEEGDAAPHLRTAISRKSVEELRTAARCRFVTPVVPPSADLPGREVAALLDPRFATGGLDAVLLSLRVGEDLTAGRGFDRFRAKPFRDGFARLMELVGSNSLSVPESERAEGFLAELLSRRPPPIQAWWSVSLAHQADLVARLARNPEDGAAFDALEILRDHLRPGRPDLTGLKDVAVRSGNDLLQSAAAEITLSAERMPDVAKGLRRDLQAVILAIRVNRYRAKHGAYPKGLDKLPPGTDFGSPGGGHFELGKDAETHLPAIFFRGGKQFGAAESGRAGFHSGGIEQPVFRFLPDRVRTK